MSGKRPKNYWRTTSQNPSKRTLDRAEKRMSNLGAGSRSPYANVEQCEDPIAKHAREDVGNIPNMNEGREIEGDRNVSFF